MKIRGFSNLIYVAELRYLQSLHEQRELQNADRLVGQFLPPFRRRRCRSLSQRRMAILRTDPLYYYLLARTKYYDTVFLNAITAQVQYIINVGCGTDTRAYRFEDALKHNGVRVVGATYPRLFRPNSAWRSGVETATMLTMFLLT